MKRFFFAVASHLPVDRVPRVELSDTKDIFPSKIAAICGEKGVLGEQESPPQALHKYFKSFANESLFNS